MNPELSSRRRRRSTTALAAVGVTLAASALTGLGSGVANASSHREAPLTAADPQHDNTDTYAFVSPDKPDTVTLIANWIPFEEPNGGPNFFPWHPKSHYDINIDSNGDGKPNITYRWTFTNVDSRPTAAHGDGGPGTFLYNDGVVNNLKDKTLLFKQTYDLVKIENGATKTIVSGATAAPSDVGRASMPNYANLRDQAIAKTNDGGLTVATQAADPFFLDLRVFDLLYGTNLKEAGQNTLAGYNVNSVVLQVPKKNLALNGNATKNPVIGVWSTTEKQSVTLDPATGAANPTGDFVQVSRLGSPLVNELVVPVQFKDAFNAIPPSMDAKAAGGAVLAKVQNPELAKLIELIYKIPAPAGSGTSAKPKRDDLVEIFLTGICKACGPIKADLNSQMLNKDVKAANFVPGEELRLNMGVPVTANPNRLGVLAMDLQGFPNGRRLNDDVVDIEIQAVEGAAQSGKLVQALAAGDGVNGPASQPSRMFPYLALPNSMSVNQASSTGGNSGGGTGTNMPSGGVATGAGGTAVLSGSQTPGMIPTTLAVLGLLAASGTVVAVGRGRRRGVAVKTTALS